MVNDEEDLVIICLVDIVVLSVLGVCEVVVDYDIVFVMDNCLGFFVVFMSGLGFGVIFFVGFSIEIYEVRDVVGNIVICSFIIKVNDIEVLVLICFFVIIVESDFGICGVVVDYSFLIVIDNCFDVVIILKDGLGMGGIFFVGMSMEIFIVIDVVGNIVFCSFMVMVNDIEVFVLICLFNIIVEIVIGLCMVVVNYEDLIVVDNCSIVDDGLIIVWIIGFSIGVVFFVGIII